MSNAKWIWYPAEYETYHHKLLSYRRQEYNCDYACHWYVANTELSVRFFRTFVAEEDTYIKVITYSKGMVRTQNGLKPVNEDILITKGEQQICVELFDFDGFCSFYLDSKYVVSDENWTTDLHDNNFIKVACEPALTSPEDDPRKFPFEYEEISPASVEEINGGKLFDFGKEMFGIITFDKLVNGMFISYGESKEEALDRVNSIIHEPLSAKDEKRRPARAFRYIFITSESGEYPDFKAEYEYLPIKDKASFKCENDSVNKIWDICSYTFHLNSREFFLDGIKRDRWVWSGDAYQSYMINNYLYADRDITRRTITALFGKPPYRTHINTINDYSAYLIIAVLEYYEATGDLKFVESVWEKTKALYNFIVSRLDERGYVVGLYGDWIFIDWGKVDKEGAVCAEQILLWKTYLSMQKLSSLLGEDGDYLSKADKLRKNILRDFWREDKKAFIDSFDSGKEQISRQSNVFAILYEIVDSARAEEIFVNVLENDNIPAITTPYFKLYELMAICKLGRIEEMQNYLESYWGGMLALGATSVWEQFNPDEQGTEHYAMYGGKYARSLCHAWGSGPILLLGKYVCGVKPTSTGYKTFEVEPKPGKYKSFVADVPANEGIVHIEYNGNSVSASADIDGGTLIFNGQKASIPKNGNVEL